jgi:DNA repair photolyase
LTPVRSGGQNEDEQKAKAAKLSFLFDDEPARPTTRAIALLVRGRGATALPSAVRRGDDVRYQEVTCRSALNRVEGMPFQWTLNPYRGCTHGCHYCYARRYQTQFELGAGDDFSTVVLVKVNLPEVLRRELERPTWTRELVALGTATDAYQPIEGHYRITRRVLEALIEARTPVGLVTKGPMAVRDRDLFVELGGVAGCTVYFSVPSVDDDVWSALEPGTAHPLQRLRAARQLADAGVRTGVLMAPVVPGFTTSAGRLERTFKAIADHGVAFAGANLLHLEGGARDHFFAFLSREAPGLLARHERLYTGKYAAGGYAEQLRARLAEQERHSGVARPTPGTRAGGPRDVSPADWQPAFDWES